MLLFSHARTLTLLYQCQILVGNRTTAGDTVNKLLHLLLSLANASIPEVYANIETLSLIAYIFRLSINGMTEEATQLEKKLIMVIKEVNATGTHHEELQKHLILLKNFLKQNDMMKYLKWLNVP